MFDSTPILFISCENNICLADPYYYLLGAILATLSAVMAVPQLTGSIPN